MASNPIAAGTPAAPIHRAGLAASLLALALLGACAAPVTRATHADGAPEAQAAAYVEHGTVRRIDAQETRHEVGAGGPALGALVGDVAGGR
jgi:outer membrane lipoprotein SlyB